MNKDKHLHIKITEDQYLKLKQVSGENKKSLGWIIRNMIVNFIDKINFEN